VLDTSPGACYESAADFKRMRETEKLTRLWEAHYMSRGLGRWRAVGLARAKARKGRHPCDLRK
jgi:hypothetical protein